MVTKGLYKHFKGGFYKVLYVATDADNIDNLVVVYESQQTGDVWVRPLKNFEEKIGEVNRFELINETNI